MPNDETATRPAPGEATPPVPPEAAGAAARSGEPDEDASLDPEQAAALSRAAREAVRQPADPRIDRQLARMGLAPEPEAPEAQADGAPDPARPGRVVRAEDVDGFERRLAELEPLAGRLAALEAMERRVTSAEAAAQDAELAAVRARRRVDQLAWVVTAEGVAIVILTALLLLR